MNSKIRRNSIIILSLVLTSCELWTSPVDDITGCYNAVFNEYTEKMCIDRGSNYANCYKDKFRAFEDRLCLGDDNIFKQYTKKNKIWVEYNSGVWRSFQYDETEGPFTAGVLSNFVLFVPDTSTYNLIVKELDIQPTKEAFSNVSFFISRKIISDKYKVHVAYVREEDK